MSKRFTDSELYDRHWFRKLPCRLKCAWDFLTKRCDFIGVWNIDMDRMSFEVGESIALEEVLAAFDCYVFDHDKLFLPGFVPFQYCDDSGHLSPKNKFHISIASKLRARGLPVPNFKIIDDFPNGCTTPLPTPSDTLSMAPGGAQGKGKGKGNSSEGGVGETNSSSQPVDQVQAFEDCVGAWGYVLGEFKIPKDPRMDGPAILRMIRARGHEPTRMAILGAVAEKSTDTFRPQDHVSITRVERHFAKFTNLGAKVLEKIQTESAVGNG